MLELQEYRNRNGTEVVRVFLDECGAEDPLEYSGDCLRFLTRQNGRYSSWGHEQHDMDTLNEKHDEATGRGALVLPVFAYYYVHSLTAFSLSRGYYPFDCPWDSGQCGMIVIEQDAIAKEWEGDEDKARTYAAAVLNEYTNWCNGNIFGYSRRKVSKCDHGHEHEEETDGCWGLIADAPDAPYILQSAGIADDDGNLIEGWREA